MSYITSDLNDQDELATLQADHTGGSKAFFSRYQNDEVVELLRQARATSDPDKRQELYCQIQDTVYHDGYSVPINFVPAVDAHHAGQGLAQPDHRLVVAARRVGRRIARCFPAGPGRPAGRDPSSGARCRSNAGAELHRAGWCRWCRSSSGSS